MPDSLIKSYLEKRHLKYFPIIPVLLVLIFCISVDHLQAASRGLLSLKTVDANGSTQVIDLYKGSYALVIGVSNYNNGWPKLPGVIQDTELVRDALEKNGFEVKVVLDPNKLDMERAFERFIKKHGGITGNRLLFYFAGHGHTVKPKYGGSELGYIVPVDAPNPYDDIQEFKRVAMSMQRIEEYSLNMDSKHAIFLFDSCFSGSLFAMTRAVPEHINYKTAKPVRQFITSGSADEKVPDKSIFRHQFIEALEGYGDVNKDGYITGSELGEFLQNKVVNYSKGSQHPQYGKIRNPNLDKGDFVFQTAKLQGTETANQTPEIMEAQVDKPIRAKLSPTYFAGRTITGGVTKKTGENFVIEMTKNGTAILTIYKKNEPHVPRKKIRGSWWISDKEWVCFKIGRFNNGNKFCRTNVIEGEKEWLVGANPTTPKWILQPR
jgi:hypothetical protein